AYNDIPGGKAGEALMTPDGTTNALSTLTTNNGYLALEDGASVGATLASFTGSTGSLTLHVVEPGGSGSTLNVGGNYDQFNTTLLGTGNALTIGGTFTSDGGTSEVDAGSTITVAGRYSQTSGTTEVNGTLMSPTVNIDGGTLSGTGTVQGAVLIVGGATVSPGDPGTMTINGSLDLGSGSTLTLEISGASDYDSLDIIGNGTFDGNVDLDFLNGFAPVSGDTFGFITDTGGTFSWNPSNISFLGVLMPGTYTINLVGGFSLTATSNWVPEPPPAQTPEPASFLLLGTGFLFLLGYSLRRRIRRASGSGSGK
ncbi:MAG: PEP-CTERM sorting domain-containing protein, partial [Terriglobia bacterium]